MRQTAEVQQKEEKINVGHTITAEKHTEVAIVPERRSCLMRTSEVMESCESWSRVVSGEECNGGVESSGSEGEIMVHCGGDQNDAVVLVKWLDNGATPESSYKSTLRPLEAHQHFNHLMSRGQPWVSLVCIVQHALAASLSVRVTNPSVKVCHEPLSLCGATRLSKVQYIPSQTWLVTTMGSEAMTGHKQ
ncbi:hypothetical protein Pcinc_020923 [Petrolisthes cinctipes]|uniref:Uncharacterized protein n=1 Tax=Petrolisthes cinctipes TaxID=88211 RepID=A0AAE1KFR6_PETCI|nr:hypothetical protein Pcinc_020923 [Petrolisthes cinctipes]